MPDRPAPTVTGLLAELHAYRVETMAPAALAANIGQRRLLEETADRDAFVKADDWLVRTEADVVIDAVRALVQVPA
jgi:hypothetical protein